ncbi:MAG: hypothetical protein KHW96_06405 [Firmicutes bacterium]|jgi:hypothetical protein|nr:hypothetical protein [Bacillota bacterium]
MEPAALPQALCVSKKVFPARRGISQDFKKLPKNEHQKSRPDGGFFGGTKRRKT